MEENLFQAKYVLTNRNKAIEFYKKNKILIFSTILVVFISIVTLAYYFVSKEKQEITLSESYITAKVYLENKEKEKAKNILKSIVLTENNPYSVLSLFLILDGNLISEQKELLSLFDQVIQNNKFEKEVTNLVIYKKALFLSNFVSESELLSSVKPLTSSETIWKPHALMLLGDYFVSKKEYKKAEEFYLEILSLKGIQKEMYEQARSQLTLIFND